MKDGCTALKLAMAVVFVAWAGSGRAQGEKPIKIGVPTSVQLQVGRDTIDCAQMAIDEINAKGGVLGRKLQMVVADETENPEQGIAAIKKLTSDEKVDVMIGGYTSGVTLAQLPHIAAAKTIYLGVGAASPAITAKVGQEYDHYKYVFRVTPMSSVKQAESVVDFMRGYLKGELGMKKVAIVGESAKWVQDLLPGLKKGAVEAGMEVPVYEVFDTSTTDFSPLLSKVKSSGAQFMIAILSHASSDVFAKQWYDARVPVPYGGIDVKSMDADFYKRVGGKSVSEVVALLALRAPITPRTIPMVDAFEKRFNRQPVYTGFGAYDAVYVFAEAAKRAGKIDNDALINELEKTNHVGAVGRITFDKNHDVKPGPGLVNWIYAQWQDGGTRVVLWPRELTTGKFVAPPWMK